MDKSTKENNSSGWLGIAYITFVIVIIMFVIYSIYKNYTLGSNEKDYEKICIEGHTYYKASYFTKGLLAIKLNTDGTPISCKNDSN